jgi:hypothetical protein
MTFGKGVKAMTFLITKQYVPLFIKTLILFLLQGVFFLFIQTGGTKEQVHIAAAMIVFISFAAVCFFLYDCSRLHTRLKICQTPFWNLFAFVLTLVVIFNGVLYFAALGLNSANRAFTTVCIIPFYITFILISFHSFRQAVKERTSENIVFFLFLLLFSLCSLSAFQSLLPHLLWTFSYVVFSSTLLYHPMPTK